MATFPDIGIQSMNMRLRSATAISSSPFSFDQQVYEHPGVLWEAEITLPPLTHSEAKTLQGFLAGLRGQSGTFTLANPLHTSGAFGTITGTVNSTSVTASIFGAEVGDYFSVDGHLHIITSISGTTFGIMPPLRGSYTGTTVDFTLPENTWRLASNTAEWSIDRASIYSFTLAIVEAL